MVQTALVPETSLKPPYVAYQTFSNFLATLGASSVMPGSINGTMSSLSGATRSQLTLCLRWLGAADEDGRPSQVLNELIKAKVASGDAWKKAVNEYVVPPYRPIFKGFDIDIARATMPQLLDVFGATGLKGSVQRKAISFFLKAFDEAGIKYSPFLRTRKSSGRAGKRGKKNKMDATIENAANGTVITQADAGYMVFPLPGARKITVPDKLSESDVRTITRYLQAFVDVDDEKD